MSKITTFGSRFGTISVVGSSVIGLGNIWRFPYIAGENGGAAFILTYVIITLMISIPLMLSEFVLGRGSRRNSVRAFRKFDEKKSLFWRYFGVVGIATAISILSFYSVIAGWAIKYLIEAVKGTFFTQSPEQLTSLLNNFTTSGWHSVSFTLFVLVVCCGVVSLGMEKGIERYSKLLMPIMFVILVAMCINSFTLPGFNTAIEFLLTPDFSKINTGVVMEALGQSFFSMSIGLGAMITYGAYLPKTENLFKISGYVAISDLTVAVLSGLAIFPAVFSFGINPTSGPDLVFLTLPNIFAQMTGGYIISIMFFFLLIAAAMTSIISLIEVLTRYICEEFQIKRKRAIVIVWGLISILSSMCVISQMPDSKIVVAGMNLFDFFDTISSNYLMPIGGAITAIFVGWFVSKDKICTELTTNRTYGVLIVGTIYRLVKFVIPIVIALLFLNGIGLFKM